MLARVAASHLRVGTFQYFAIRGETDALRRVADYAIARHYPCLLYTSDAADDQAPV
nr:protein adenylyltransferase SelO family protein [Chromobacterium sp. ASV5]